MGRFGEFGANLAINAASGLAAAATRSAIEGTSFGDAALAALPDIIGQTIGQTIGEAAAGGIQQAQQNRANVRLLNASGLESRVVRGQVVTKLTVDGETFDSTLPGRTLALAAASGRTREQLARDLADPNNRTGLTYTALGEFRAGQPPVGRVYIIEEAGSASQGGYGEPAGTSRDESIFRPLATGVAGFGEFARANRGEAEFGVFAISALSGGPVKKSIGFAVDNLIGGELDKFETHFERAFATSLAERGVDAGSSLFIAGGAITIGSILLRGNPRNGVLKAINTADRAVEFAGLMRTGAAARAAAAGGPTPQELLTMSAMGAASVAAGTQAQQVHGNSSLSQKPTEVYHLINLASGDIDKIGITDQIGATPNTSGRYSATYLASEGVQYQRVMSYQSRYPAIVHENIELVGYYMTHGRLPRLNKVFR